MLNKLPHSSRIAGMCVSKARLYAETAEVYHRRYYQIQRVKYQALVQHLPEGLLLDVGIGTGIGLLSLVEQKPVVGVDFSVEMLEIAQHQIKTNSYWRRNVSLVCASAENLPFRSYVFPIIVSVTLIQNLSEPEQGLNEFFRVLQLSGLLGITSLAKRTSIKWLKSLITDKCLILTQMSNLANEDIGLILKRKPNSALIQ